MLEVVTDDDICKFAAIAPGKGERAKLAAQRQAAVLLTEIVQRMPRPRGYICEPLIDPKDPRAVLWAMAYDILTAILPEDDHVSVIEGGTLRKLASYCRALDNFTTAVNPFWQWLTSFKLIDVVYLPDTDSEDSKRHDAIRMRARDLQIFVVDYRPRLETVHVPRVSPPTV